VSRQNRDVTFVGVPSPFDGTPEQWQTFADGMSTPISHVFDNPQEIWTEYDVVSQPTMIFVAADGTLTRFVGGVGPTKLLERVDELLTIS